MAKSKLLPSVILQTTAPDLYAMMQAGTLIPGMKYEFSYQTKYLMPYTDSTIFEGREETLVATATSVSKISPIVSSQKHSKDIIYYDITKNTIALPDVNETRGVDEFPTPIYNMQGVGANVVQMNVDIRTLYGWSLTIGDTSGDITCDSDTSMEGVDYSVTDMGLGVYRVTILGFTGDIMGHDNKGYADFYDVQAPVSRTGWITRRIDVERNINIPHDFYVKSRRWLIDLSSMNYNPLTSYYRGMQAYDPATDIIYISKINANSGNSITDNVYWDVLLESAHSTYYLAHEGTLGGQNTNFTHGVEYQDYDMFGDITQCKNIHIDFVDTNDNDMEITNSIFDGREKTDGLYARCFQDNTVKEPITKMTALNGIYNTLFKNGMISNIVCNRMYGNIIEYMNESPAIGEIEYCHVVQMINCAPELIRNVILTNISNSKFGKFVTDGYIASMESCVWESYIQNFNVSGNMQYTTVGQGSIVNVEQTGNIYYCDFGKNTTIWADHTAYRLNIAPEVVSYIDNDVVNMEVKYGTQARYASAINAIITPFNMSLSNAIMKTLQVCSSSSNMLTYLDDAGSFSSIPVA